MKVLDGGSDAALATYPPTIIRTNRLEIVEHPTHPFANMFGKNNAASLFDFLSLQRMKISVWATDALMRWQSGRVAD